MAVTIWDGSTDGNFATGANWDTTAKPIAGDEIIFDSNSSVALTEGMLASETGNVEFDSIHAKLGHTGNVGTALEPLAVGAAAAAFPVIIEGSGTYHIMCANSLVSSDAILPLVIINNPDATVYLYSFANDTQNICVFTNVHLIAGTLFLSTEATTESGDGNGAIVTNLYIQPRNAQKSNATCTIAIDNERLKGGAVYTNLYMANGTLTTDSGLGTVHFQNGTINVGTDGGGGTNVDIGILKMYGGSLAWNPNEDAAVIGQAHIYGGTVSVSKTINAANTRVLGSGAGNDIYFYTGSKLNLDGGRGQVTVGTQLISMGGRLTLDSFTEIGITNDPDIS